MHNHFFSFVLKFEGEKTKIPAKIEMVSMITIYNAFDMSKCLLIDEQGKIQAASGINIPLEFSTRKSKFHTRMNR